MSVASQVPIDVSVDQEAFIECSMTVLPSCGAVAGAMQFEDGLLFRTQAWNGFTPVFLKFRPSLVWGQGGQRC
jgi:hypothetical protein